MAVVAKSRCASLLMLVTVALGPIGCSPEGTGTVSVPAAAARRATARSGVLPDPNTGAPTTPAFPASRSGPGQTVRKGSPSRR